MTLSEATDAVGKLLTRYPNGGQNAGRGYIGGLAEVLMAYPRSVALRVHDVLTGVPREVKFLPTPSDVIAWCERETAVLRGPVEREDENDHIIEQMRQRREEAERLEADRASRPTLAELKDKHGPNWGLATADKLDPKRLAIARENLQRANETLRRRENIAAGMDPDAPVSAALVKTLREQGAIPQNSEAAE